MVIIVPHTLVHPVISSSNWVPSPGTCKRNGFKKIRGGYYESISSYSSEIYNVHN